MRVTSLQVGFKFNHQDTSLFQLANSIAFLQHITKKKKKEEEEERNPFLQL
jgi:hypothetical protein